VKKGPPAVARSPCHCKPSAEENPLEMLQAGLDLSRKNLDICLLSEEGEQLD
jgi:hypothetical protein